MPKEVFDEKPMRSISVLPASTAPPRRKTSTLIGFMSTSGPAPSEDYLETLKHGQLPV